jgi:hypothetical protein
MLCPCCGHTMRHDMRLGEPDCSCGARIVGEPLDDAPIKIRRFGPALTALASLLAVALASLISLWASFGLILIAWLSWRALRLAGRDPEWYGGYRVSLASFGTALLAGAILSAYGAAHIRLAFHINRLYEEYKSKYGGSFPPDLEAIRKVTPELSPIDSWGNNLVVKSYTDAVAEAPGRNGRLKVISFNNVEIRSAGPDGKMGTADDIIMRDGVFLTASEVAKQPPPRDPVGH